MTAAEQKKRPNPLRMDQPARIALRLAWVCASSLGAGLCWAQVDLSLLSDFGRSDITLEHLGLSPTASNAAGIEQQGSSNAARIEQSGGSGNNAQVWQIGNNSSADVTQTGSDNELRLLQNGDYNTANLIQIGSGNQLAIQQMGSYGSVIGLQQGSGNQFVMQQAGSNSNFQFSQVGDGNQMVVNLPLGMNMRVDQVGNGLSANIAPGQ